MAQSRWGDTRALVAFVAMVLVGGDNVVAVRLSDRGLAPFFGAGVRFVSAAVLLYMILAFRHIALPTRAQLKGTLLYGLFGFGTSYAFAYVAMMSLSSVVAAVLLGFVPLITLFLAVGQGVERFKLRGLIGAVIAILGIVALVGMRSDVHVPVGGLLLLLGAAFSISESSIVLKKYPTGHPMATNAVAMGFGGILLLALSLVSGEHWSLPATTMTWVSLVYLIVPGSILLFALFLFTLKRWPASRVAYLTVLTPFVASFTGTTLAGDAITLPMVVGGLIVLTGVYIGSLSAPKAPAAPRIVEEPAAA
jgi:drug/metabolite transporter (DMT)-like permease